MQNRKHVSVGEVNDLRPTDRPAAAGVPPQACRETEWMLQHLICCLHHSLSDAATQLHERANLHMQPGMNREVLERDR